MDFARAAASLGTSRGVGYFERYGFVMRSGKAFLAVPLGKQKVSSQVTDAARLIDDLDADRWLDRIRQFTRKNDSFSYGREVLKQLEDSIFEITKTGVNSRSVQNVLSSLGSFVSWFARSGNALDEKPPPPPLLSSNWVSKANDGTYEYRVACALASIGWHYDETSETDSEIEETSSLPSSDQESTESDNEFDLRIAMAAHFAPVIPSSIFKRSRKWDSQSNERLVVFTAGDLISGLIAVLERRLIEQAKKGLKDKPLYASTHVSWSDISAFLSPGFNHALCARLLSGLIWTRPAGYLELDTKNTDHPTPCFPYLALKPLFTPDRILEKANILTPGNRMPIPSGLVAQLRSDNVDNAVRMALARARASGIDSPFAAKQFSRGISQFCAVVNGRLLAASLLIPLREWDLKYVMERAYTKKEETKTI